ncbi:hypothetical protein RUND412_000763 [Rhizina undulata]
MKLEPYNLEKPLNREPTPRELVKTFITEASLAYDRNHSPFPYIDAKTHKVYVDGAVKNPLSLTIDSLRNDFAQHEVIATLQCAGNRRHTMRTKFKEVDGINWKDGAVCNCIWRGPLLADILKKARPTLAEAHVEFSCFQLRCQDDEYYAGSVSLSRCLDLDKQAILALDMNGAPLTVNHGFPVRIVMPGIAGARWTKWLDKITIQDHESLNYYMQRDYKILPPHINTREKANAYWHKVPALQQMPINSVVAYPTTGDVIPARSLRNGELEISGYALPQADDGPVTGVEVSLDQGETWQKAEIVFPTKEQRGEDGADERYRWAWAVWKFRVKKERIRETTKIWSRARDKGGNLQLGDARWNFRGVAYNGYGEAERVGIVEDGVQANGNGVWTNGVTNGNGRK